MLDELNIDLSFLNELIWKLDEEGLELDIPIPREYTKIEWTDKYKTELKNVINFVFENAKPYIPLDSEPYECFTCVLFENYYYGVFEKEGCTGFILFRTYFEEDKLQKVTNFVNSNKFVYKNEMCLDDILISSSSKIVRS